jgi:hypothetical protein
MDTDWKVYDERTGVKLLAVATDGRLVYCDTLALVAYIAHLRELAYLGDHYFPDLTYKARLAELAEKMRAAT